MVTYVLRRLLVAIPTMLIIITATFFLMRAAPGNPYALDRKLPPAIEANVRAYYNLDKPLIVQYGMYVSGLVRGDMGPSLKLKDKTVSDIIVEGLPVSAFIGAWSLLIALFVGSGLGIIAALSQNTWRDYLVMSLAVVGICIPPLVMGPLLSLLFGIQLGWLPAGGTDPRLGLTFSHAILPVMTLALPQVAIISRLMRASMIEVIRSNYVRTARAKGLSDYRVVTRHALKAAILPLISYLGPAAAGLMTGSVVIEKVFQLPGIGRQFVDGAMSRDYTVVMGVVVVYAGLIMLFNLIADILYGLLDPKVKYS